MQRLLPAFTVLLLLLGGCSTTSEQHGQVVFSGSQKSSQQEDVSDADVFDGSDPFARARALADILYEARIAYEDNRLMSPNSDNAYDRYREVLQLDPGNEVALQGIQDIVLRYIELGDNALRQSDLEEAEQMLDRAARLNPESPELLEARIRLQNARSNKIESFPLDPQGLREQSLVVMAELGEIADYIRRREARFLINARTDAEVRWIYKVMRESVGGYRLRGNIDIAAEPVILVTVPGS